MKHYIVGDLNNWHAVETGEILAFDSRGPRRVKLEVNASGPVELYAGVGPLDKKGKPDQKGVLVAADRGLFSVQYTASASSWLYVVGEDGAKVFIKGNAPDHRVAKSDVPVLTNIAPRVRRNTEYDRMIMQLKMNEQRREKQYQQMMRRMEAAGTAGPEVKDPEPPKKPDAGVEDDEKVTEVSDE